MPHPRFPTDRSHNSWCRIRTPERSNWHYPGTGRAAFFPWRLKTALRLPPDGAQIPADTISDPVAFTDGLRLAILVAFGITLLCVVFAILVGRGAQRSSAAEDPELVGVPQLGT